MWLKNQFWSMCVCLIKSGSITVENEILGKYNNLYLIMWVDVKEVVCLHIARRQRRYPGQSIKIWVCVFLVSMYTIIYLKHVLFRMFCVDFGVCEILYFCVHFVVRFHTKTAWLMKYTCLCFERGTFWRQTSTTQTIMFMCSSSWYVFDLYIYI